MLSNCQSVKMVLTMWWFLFGKDFFVYYFLLFVYSTFSSPSGLCSWMRRMGAGDSWAFWKHSERDLTLCIHAFLNSSRSIDTQNHFIEIRIESSAYNDKKYSVFYLLCMLAIPPHPIMLYAKLIQMKCLWVTSNSQTKKTNKKATKKEKQKLKTNSEKI